MDLNIVDKLGQPIMPGDFITYGSLLGRCAALRIGKVLDIRKRQPEGYRDPVGISIIVWGVEDGFDSPHYKRETVLCMKKGALQFPERVIVLPREMVPEKYLTLLDPVTLDKKGTTWFSKHRKFNKLEK